MIEGQHQDRKSLRIVRGRREDWRELAWVCVGMANAHGGTILIGVEDGTEAPPAGQQVDDALVDRVRKRIPQLTVNVAVAAERATHTNGGQVIELRVLPSRSTVARRPPRRRHRWSRRERT